MGGCSLSKTLLIIGAGIEQVPAYQKAKARGFFVVASDQDPKAPALKYADAFIQASTRDAKETTQEALAFHSTHPIDGVMTIANDVPYTVASVAHALKLPGISLKAAQLASNKLQMKEAFIEHGVPCPWFKGIESLGELQQALASHYTGHGFTQHATKFVIKPIDGRGARGVLLIDRNSDLPRMFLESKKNSDTGRLMIEKFVSGPQLSTESFIYKGKCYTAAIAERHYERMGEFAPYIIEDGGTLPALINEEQRKWIDDVILEGARAMGINHGIIKGDLVINDKGKPMIIELAARLSGGWFASHHIPIATGIDLINVVISYALGEPIDEAELLPKWQKATSCRYWFPKPGTIKAITGVEALKKTPGLVSYGFFRKPGEMQPVIRSHPDRLGFVIVQGETRTEAKNRVEQALESVKIDIL